MSNQYIYGNTQAVLTMDKVDASWKSDPQAPKILAFLNYCFEFYYKAYNAADAALDSSSDDMCSSLLHAANAGAWGAYVPTMSGIFGKIDSLSQGFDLLDKNSRWNESEGVVTYLGGADQFGGMRFALTLSPWSAYNFGNAVNKVNGQLRGYVGNFLQEATKVQESADDSNWKKLGEALEKIERYHGYIKPLLWLAPKELTEHVEELSTWNENILKVHGKASQVMALNGTNQPGATVLFTALAAVVKGVPIIGSIYSQMLKELPGFCVQWTSFWDDYYARRLHTTRFSARAGWYQ